MRSVLSPLLASRSPCLAAWLGLLAAVAGCDTLREPEPSPGAIRVIELDQRSPKRAGEVPPPIQGGSLLALSDGTRAVVGDPDRHRILVVDVVAGVVEREFTLPPGARPGRMAQDAAGRVHVVVRGLHRLLSLDPATGEILGNEAVCSEPRGLAYEPDGDALRLACADGTLLTFSVETGETLSEQFIAPDLRDVVPDENGGVWLTTFHSAEIYHVSRKGRVTSEGAVPSLTAFVFEQGGAEPVPLQPHGAWRAIGDRQGGIAVVHQRATTRTIEIPPHGEEDKNQPDEDGVLRQPVGTTSVGSYGGGLQIEGVGPGISAGCDAIVTSAVSTVGFDGAMRSTSPLPDAILPVDIAVSPIDRKIAIVSAGPRDHDAPKATFVFPDLGRDELPTAFGECVDGSCEPFPSTVHLLAAGAVQDEPNAAACLPAAQRVRGIEAPAISVAFSLSHLLVQIREPSRLYVVDPARAVVIRMIDLGGPSVADTGHDLFHRDAGGGIACASCHLEGTEDGHVWRFTGLGARRTQPLNVKLRGTQPFHWDGALEDVGPLMSEVFVGRMGGAPQADDRLAALGDWVLDLKPPAPIRAPDDPAALRGKALFESAAVGCVLCHNGPSFTNNLSVDVGTSDGVPLQVPSLRGVGRRAPLMHDGCAAGLRQRFDPECGGGDAHGTTSHLTEDDLEDLIAFMQTL